MPARADLAVLQYHHISNETPSATSTTPSLFRGQIDMIQNLELPVRPLEDATKSALAGELGKEPVIAITFDDAYSSVYETAAPLLLQRDMPFTIFVNTQAITEGRRGYMTWEQLNELAANPEVTIGNHSADHGHLVRKPDETEDAWRERVTTSLDEAQATLEKKLGQTKPLFAYPYGEFSAALEALVAERNWYGYGQHSGAVGETSGVTRLPRFPMATSYGQLSSLENKLMSRALPVAADSLPDGIVDINPPTMTLELPEDMKPGPLTCYGSGAGRLNVTETGQGHTVKVSADTTFSSRRFRYNCTYPAGNGRFYWQSVQWVDLSKPED
ncbi:polysaccharide deacetylase family protein [Marinobacter fonticola]|uniref:polysaccharide deacetylase family protein n=1 Tax=Marinobacter fonticola TaxID=2603215 RepID=UPI0011E6CF4A